ncbi:uncharacterized protein TRIREDRAFT_3783 [Trichoderma reesei QM6a]|uniref:Predicted protein n=2 Tax=Hypocrea jecorina TaxID=51453 RepID=G0RI17_HYPJQ|nr:uncharacterized protein TRIREDRAFT_3783 [Trichoderma reesei QM6a]EGR49187.1 predicted protein [Trichoderma reesei QM6a]ETS02419.1 transcriptional regulator [Trichoderma reesei RUT C-30]
MAPSAAKLKEALIEGTREVYQAEPDATSVNKVRRHVEEKLGLENGFFTSETWKQKSKTIIKEQVDKLLEEDASEPKSEPDTKAGIKRQSSEVESPEPKRRKKVSGGAKKKEESDVDENPKKDSKAKAKKLVSRRKVKADDSDDEDAKLEESPSPPGEGASVKKGELSDDETKPSVKAQSDSGVEDSKADVKDESKPEVNEEDEYSDVIDEPPPPKRKRGEKKEASSKRKASKSTAKKEAVPDDPKEAEIKKLQSHLTKCGVRKLWHNELKQYGDDANAKIRHLKKMLADVGMDGRFSEAKAREIREMRELQADVEAAQEMDRLWGTSSGGRASRSGTKAATKQAKPESGENNDDNDDDDEEDEPTSFAARRRKAHADLAFLGDDSDSD